MEGVTGYKIARPDGWDFYTGKTINYRKSIGKIVKLDQAKIECEEVFTKKINIASAYPNDCFYTDTFTYVKSDDNFHLLGYDAWGEFHYSHRYLLYVSRKRDTIIDKLDCSVYRIKGLPIYEEKRYWGFEELEVIEEIKNLDALFGWKYSEAINPIDPLSQKHKVNQEDIDLLVSWVSLYQSSTLDIIDTVFETIKKRFGSNLRELIWDTLVASTANKTASRIWKELDGTPLDEVPMNNLVKRSFIFSFEALCYAYIGSLFPNIYQWKKIQHKKGEYPFKPAADLWRKGLLPSFDGKIWRLHSGKNAKMVYEERIP